MATKKIKNEDKYAVVKINGRQYMVNEGQELLVDKLSGKAEAEVLLMVDGSKVEIGDPVVKGAKVSLKVLEAAEKGKKVKTLKFKAKSRYRKRIGHRPVMTRLQVGKIS